MVAWCTTRSMAAAVVIGSLKIFDQSEKIRLDVIITLRRADGGPDSSFSIEPSELRDLVRDVRLAHAALGKVSYAREASEKANLMFRRSLYVVANIAITNSLHRNLLALSDATKQSKALATALRSQNLTLDAALNTMIHGLAMFDRKLDLAVSNAPPAALDGIP